MKFDLHITISGLCLLAADESQRRLVVLMPKTNTVYPRCGGGGTEHVPAHLARLVYEPEYEAADQAVGPGVVHGHLIHRDVEGIETVLGGGEPGAIGLALGDAVADLDGMVKRQHLTDDVPGAVRSRIVVRAGRAETRHSGLKWKFRGASGRTLTPGLEWVIKRYGDDRLTLPVVGGNVTLEQKNGRIKIGYYHVPESELPTEIGEHVHGAPAAGGTVAPHFHAYYGLCQAGSIACPSIETAPAGATGAGGIRPLGTNPFACLISTARVEAAVVSDSIAS